MLYRFVPAPTFSSVAEALIPFTLSVVKLSFGTQSLYRNVSASFKDYYPALLACNSTTPVAVKWTFYNATSPTTAITSNVLMKGFTVDVS